VTTAGADPQHCASQNVADKAIATAVDKAGAHCHAKGQKFMLKSAVGKTVVFRCVPMNPGAPEPATAQAPQPLPPPPQ
jgi:hypothetical protein